MRDQAKAVLDAIEHPDVHLNSTLWARFKTALVSYIHVLEGEEEHVEDTVEHALHIGDPDAHAPSTPASAPASQGAAPAADPTPKEGE